MPRRRVAVTAALALSMATLSPLAAHAASGPTTYYVDVDNASCSSSGQGTQAAPFCTIQQGAASATTPGDTVLIAPGSYYGEVDITASGTASAPITFESATQTVLPENIDLRLNASTDSYGLYLNGASYISLSGFAIYSDTGYVPHSVDLANSSHMTLDTVGGPGNVVLTGNSGDDTVSRSRFSAYDGGQGPQSAAFAIDSSGTGNVITTNLADVGTDGLAGITVTGSADADIISNTVWGYCGAGIAVGDDANGTASGATIENNLVTEAVTNANDEGSCAAATTAGISVQSAADLSGATGQGAADSNENPVIVQTGGIINETSPAINAANSDAPHELTTDLDGNPRVHDPNVPETGAGTEGYDRGALQFQEALLPGTESNPATAPAGASVTFDLTSPRSNWANATFTYVFDFGDGTPDVTTSQVTSITHTYASAGSYRGSVTETSSFGATAHPQFSITVLQPVPFAVPMAPTTEYGTGVAVNGFVATDWPITTETIDYGDGYGPHEFSVGEAPLLSHLYADPGTYTITLAVADQGGDAKTVTASITTTGSDFSPMTPTRLLDTRKGLGGTSAQLADDGSITLKIAGTSGIPKNVTAVDLNLTAVNGTGGGYIQADTGTDNGTSTLNYGKSLIYSNSVIAQVGADGTVTLRNFAGSSATRLDLIADVSGYFFTSGKDRFDFVTTSRIMDTRNGTGGSTGALAAGGTDVLTAAGAGGLPASGVAAVSVNLTVTGTTQDGYLVAYPDGTATPGTSDVNWQGATTKATAAIIPVGADGKIDIANGSTDGGVSHVLVDVTGYFMDSTKGDVYLPVPPARVLDTRTGSPIEAKSGQGIGLSGVDGMPTINDLGAVDGYVLNTTATDTGQAGWLLLIDDDRFPATSTVNWTGPGQTVANLSFTQTDQYLSEYAYNGSPSKPVQAIVDVMGYFRQS